MNFELLLLPILSFIVAFLAMPLLAKHAHKMSLVDLPDQRKKHRLPTPVVGGIALILALIPYVFLSQTLALPNAGILLCAAAIFLVGVIDDVSGLSYRIRFLSHFLVGILMVMLTAVELKNLGDLLGTGPIFVGLMSVPLTAFAVASAVNAYNLIDGLDGLASGLSFTILIIVVCLTQVAGLFDSASFALTTAAAVFAFMLFNYPGLRRSRVRCFLGDAGSNLLGLILVYLLIDLSQKGIIYPITALFIFGWPLMDTAAVILRRRLAGVSPAVAGNDHIHHLLLASGLGRTATVICIQVATLLFALLGLALMKYPETVSFAVYVATLLGYLWVTRRPEELAQRLRQALFPVSR